MQETRRTILILINYAIIFKHFAYQLVMNGCNGQATFFSNSGKWCKIKPEREDWNDSNYHKEIYLTYTKMFFWHNKNLCRFNSC